MRTEPSDLYTTLLQLTFIPLSQLLFSLRTLVSPLYNFSDSDTCKFALTQPSTRRLYRNNLIRCLHMYRFGGWRRGSQAYKLEGVGWESREGKWRRWTISGVGGSPGLCRY